MSRTEPEKRNGHLALEPRNPRLWLLSLAAAGIVYGDIGTSPLYALRESLLGARDIGATSTNVFGVLSLIFWSLIIVICLKYLGFLMRIDNDGEGGVLALQALVEPTGGKRRGGRVVLSLLGLFGAALLYGDGVITPAISVLSAVEGLELASETLGDYVIPISVVILVALFAFQRRGTEAVGVAFGPIMMVWFVTLGVLGIRGILGAPEVMGAVNPIYAVQFFAHNGLAGFLVVGAVFLVVTGGEALYADLGHLGKWPIRITWFLVVLPGLLLNYFGQGALLLQRPDVVQPFYELAPEWAYYPLIALATAATVIASQAIITGAFSLTRQAILLGNLPWMHMKQTSEEEIRQTYLPVVNWSMAAVTIALVLTFRRSENLAAAYGVAVSTTMLITTLLAYAVWRDRKDWNPWLAGGLAAAFLAIDFAFFSANLMKIHHGGWLPILLGGLIFAVMLTWRRGQRRLRERLRDREAFDDPHLDELKADELTRVPGIAIFMTGGDAAVATVLRHHLSHMPALHEKVILLEVVTESRPRVPYSERLRIRRMEHGLTFVVLRYGFMQTPHVPAALKASDELGIDMDDATFFIGARKPVPDTRIGEMPLWMERVFALLARNALPRTAFYHIPPQQVVELGIQVPI